MFDNEEVLNINVLTMKEVIAASNRELRKNTQDMLELAPNKLG